jgi:hypothetical protein
MVYDEELAPLMFVPFLRHWYVKMADPVAVTLNVTDSPTHADWPEGGTVITGTEFTVTVV